MTTSKKSSSKQGTVHVIVFSNFEGWLQNFRPAVLWFEACSKARPKTFGAGYSVANSALQAMLARIGFTVSLAYAIPDSA
jgi:hypothetical protein